MRMMTAKYAGTCRKCNGRIRKGDKIGFAGKGLAYHQECTQNVAGRQVAISETRFSSGAVMFTNSNGRCEDAPCCGCCS